MPAVRATLNAATSILHLVSTKDGGEGALISAQGAVRAHAGHDVTHRVVVIGPSAHARLARAVFAEVDVPVTFHSVPRRRWPVHLVGSGLLSRACRPTANVTIAYALDALLAFSAPLRDARADFFVTDRAPPPHLDPVTRLLVQYALSSTPVITPCAEIARHWRALAPAVEVASPAAGPPRVAPERRAAARAALGIQPGAMVVIMLADPHDSGDARRFLHECGTVFESGSPVVGLIARAASGLPRAARYQQAFGRVWPLIAGEGTMSALLEAADVAVYHPASPLRGGLVLARLAVDRGIALIAPCSPSILEVVGPQPTLAAGADYLSLARALLLVVRGHALGMPVTTVPPPAPADAAPFMHRLAAHLRVLRGDAPSRAPLEPAPLHA